MLAFECDESISAATTNPRQQNPCMTSEIIFATIPCCTVYCIKNSLYSILFIPNCIKYFLMHQLLLTISVITSVLTFS